MVDVASSPCSDAEKRRTRVLDEKNSETRHTSSQCSDAKKRRTRVLDEKNSETRHTSSPCSDVQQTMFFNVAMEER